MRGDYYIMEIEKYKKVFDDHNGIIKLAEFTEAGFHNTIMYDLINEGYVNRIKTGYYEWLYDKPVAEATIISKLFPEGIVCMDSALYIYGYTEKTPIAWHLAVSKDKSKKKYQIDYPLVKMYFLIDAYLSIGLTTITYDKTELKIFDRDRTICDVIRYGKKMDKEVFNKSIRAYVYDSAKNITKLLEYSKRMNISNKVKSIIGMYM